MATSPCSFLLLPWSVSPQCCNAGRRWNFSKAPRATAIPTLPSVFNGIDCGISTCRFSTLHASPGIFRIGSSRSFHLRSACNASDGDRRAAVSTEEESQEYNLKSPSEFQDGTSFRTRDAVDGLAISQKDSNGHSGNLNSTDSNDNRNYGRIEALGSDPDTDAVSNTGFGRLDENIAVVVEAAEKVAEVAVEVVSEAAEKVAEVAVEVVSETVEVAAQTVSAVGEIADLPSDDEETPVLDQSVAFKTVAFWVSAAVAFGTAVGLKQGTSKASEFFAGYLLEQSLSVDNLFVFVLIFSYFKVPYAYQRRVLTYGIAGAVVFRAVMIGLGIASLQKFEALNLLFAAILLFSAVKLYQEDEDEDEDLSNNFIVKLCRRFLPVSDSYDGSKFLTVEDGVTKATPLLLTLVVVELSDVAFAVDSIPAVFGVTRDPFIVFTSNIFAILVKYLVNRAVEADVNDEETNTSVVAQQDSDLYTLLYLAVWPSWKYLQPAVGLVLGFIGLKMVGEFLGLHVPTEASLGVVAIVLGLGVGLSLKDRPKDD